MGGGGGVGTQPLTVVCKVEARSEYVHVAHTLLHVLGADLCALSVLSNKISATELSREIIKSALLVGTAAKPRFLPPPPLK